MLSRSHIVIAYHNYIVIAYHNYTVIVYHNYIVIAYHNYIVIGYHFSKTFCGAIMANLLSPCKEPYTLVWTLTFMVQHAVLSMPLHCNRTGNFIGWLG